MTVTVGIVCLPIYVLVRFHEVNTTFLRMEWHKNAAAQYEFVRGQKLANRRAHFVIRQVVWDTDLENASRPQKSSESMRPPNFGFLKLEFKRTSSFHDTGNLLNLASIPIVFSVKMSHSSQATTFIFENCELLP